MDITGKTKLLGVIGHPIDHSLSPIMHNAALREMGLDYLYVPFAIKPADLGQAIGGFAAIGLQGFSVTIPHKQAVLPYLSDVTELARAVGAVNTIWRSEAGWHGTNTDVEGFLAPLRQLNQNWDQSTALVLGNGGAARAVVVGCTQLGYGKICVVGRDPQKLQDFLQSWTGSPVESKLRVYTWDALPNLLPQTHLLVNTTPIGMGSTADQSPLSEAEVERLPAMAIVYDLIYTPSPTRLLQYVKARGAVAMDGLEMLVQQGAVALQLWLQRPVPVNTMRQALRQHLDCYDTGK